MRKFFTRVGYPFLVSLVILTPFILVGCGGGGGLSSFPFGSSSGLHLSIKAPGLEEKQGSCSDVASLTVKLYGSGFDTMTKTFSITEREGKVVMSGIPAASGVILEVIAYAQSWDARFKGSTTTDFEPGQVTTIKLTLNSVYSTDLVTFSNQNLEAKVREAINKRLGNIVPSDLYDLKTLEAAGISVENLAGIEYCVNLEELDLGSNQIQNIDKLENLTRLQNLNLNNNKITDIGKLAQLTNLENLDFRNNSLDTGDLSDLNYLEDSGVSVDHDVDGFYVEAPANASNGVAFDLIVTARYSYKGIINIGTSTMGVSAIPEEASGFYKGELTVSVTLTYMGKRQSSTTIWLEDSNYGSGDSSTITLQ